MVEKKKREKASSYSPFLWLYPHQKNGHVGVVGHGGRPIRDRELEFQRLTGHDFGVRNWLGKLDYEMDWFFFFNHGLRAEREKRKEKRVSV